MTRRVLILLPLLAFLLVQLSFAATEVLLPRQKTKQTPPAAGAEKLPPVNILSIIPAQGEPGITVTLYGTGFSEDTTVFLGNDELSATVTSPKQLSFDIPKLGPGLYALYLKREDGTTSKTYNFTLLPQKPVATSLSPDTIYACAPPRDRDVTIEGSNFRQGSQVLFDGASIKSRVSSAEAISFSTPQVPDGLHQVQVRNPEDTVSGVLGLVIDGRPEITGVTQGEESVNHYNLIIDGRNFQQTSTLIVMEDRTLDQNVSQPGVDIKRVTSLSINAVEREQITYVNCNRIIYQRNPYSSTPKNFRIQVLNPGSGGESSLVSVSAP